MTPLVEHPPSVAVVVLAGDEVVLVRQRRPGAPTPVLELPGETLEPGETPIDAAARGLAEECGLLAEDWVELGAFWAAPAYSSERVHVLAGRVSGATAASPDADEEIEVERRPLAELPQALDDGISLAAFSLWSRR